MSVHTSFGRHAWALRCNFDRDTDPSDATVSESPRLRPGIAALLEAFRRNGHQWARLDPLAMPDEASAEAPALGDRFDDPLLHPAQFGLSPHDPVADDGATVLGASDVGALRERLQALYCGTLSLDLSAVRDEDRRRWWQQRMEAPQAPLTTAGARDLLARLARVEGWERHLQQRFPHGKRFSLEGCEALLPLLDAVLDAAAGQGVDQVLMGMPHRGRVNVLVNLMGRRVDEITDYFETAPAHPERQRDLVYHLGGESQVQTSNGPVRVRLSANPSHLQSVYPVVVGMTRAARSTAADRPDRCMAVVMHGDAAFAGQGVVMETLAMGQKPGYEVGGVVHIIINNQLGFTEPNRMDAQAARYCTDPTRMVDAPVLRASADDPEAVLRAARLAVDYRARFGTDVVIDLVGYRRFGHSEHDVPALTSPDLYRRIPAKPGVTTLYAQQLAASGRLAQAVASQLADEVNAFDPASPLLSATPIGGESTTPPNGAVNGAANASSAAGASKAPSDVMPLHELLTALADLPPSFQPHPLLRDQLARWRAMAADDRQPADWCTAEALAWAQVLQAGVGVRLSGLDVQRGTFLHRHAVWHHQGGEGATSSAPAPSTWTPLARFASKAARWEVHNSVLSEEAVLGYEYGHSVQGRDVLTVWEAQFGDFVNGAQVYLDQYISSGEEKWGVDASLTVLLPHGYEGVGPEHSNGFLSRVLQLCGADNLRVAMPSTSGQYAQLLRRQALDPVRKPLIVLTPKAVLLGESRSHTPVGEVAGGHFQTVLDDASLDEAQAGAVRSIVLSSGKVHYDLLSGREAQPEAASTALVRVEQLYPFPSAALAAVLRRYPQAEQITWVQEETRNQGAWHFVRDELTSLLPAGVALREVSRAVTAAGATASAAIHRQQQAALVRRALTVDLSADID
ncbi:2-oxoglutarate dehydrogenase E1 component [Roseateles amylovorans]|uniref:oxoglutarate dehydrogenase (succinyl-transferring) n=1 Tax=Roseateles amylovorans TaxID=2978473 RepID=A0ABY6B0M4_9BURK|nr:2-oxoglutarate dehydrogenase E1 component [Roseateles amylovorans]UXH77088.1 2-oxoglutarate dehydrogenase E1 component [Roseateles amylovorans]